MTTNAFSLDDIRTATIKRFAATEVALTDGTTVELKSMLKLKKSDRKEINAAIDLINEIDDTEDEDDELIAEWSATICEAIEKVLRLVCCSPHRLIADLDHEDPQVKASLYTAVLTRWVSETQVGEAASSPS